jgi:hypothetical protein
MGDYRGPMGIFERYEEHEEHAHKLNEVVFMSDRYVVRVQEDPADPREIMILVNGRSEDGEEHKPLRYVLGTNCLITSS